MDPSPPSQSQTAPKTTLFSSPDGTPIRVFTQADLFGRAKVLKALRLNGAELLSDASTAQIMLVDPTTRQGRQFIRDWGKDSNMTVLSFPWVEKCLRAKRPLLEEDLWGGCLAQDDGRPIDCGEGLDGAVEDDRQKSPLPTPRVTPEERARMLSRARTSNPRQASVSSRSQADDASMTAPSPAHTANNSSASILPDTVPSQPPSPGDIPPMSGMNPFMLMQNPTALNMQNISPAVLALTAQATQAVMANMLMNMNPNQQPFSNDAFMLALQDTMRNRAVAGWPGIQPQNGTLPTNQSVSPLPEPPVPYPSAPSSSNARGMVESESPMLEASGSRRVSSPSKFDKNTKRASSPASKRRKISLSSSKDVEMDDARASTQTDKLFVTKGGRALSFFVQIEIHNRFKLVSSIKKNGGTIVDTTILADYAVLYAGNQRQKVFKTLLQAAQNSKVPAVQAKFVHDCLSKGKMLDPTNYLYEPEFKRKRRHSASVESESDDDPPSIDEAERKRLAKNARELERRKKNKIAKQQDAMQTTSPSPTVKTPKPTRRAKSVDVSYPRATDGPRTPSPPPKTTRETCPQGYRFSSAENEFALRFAKTMIDRDYTISQSAVVTAIHKKLPHHTLLSWRSHFCVIAGEWDTWRKRSAIAHRKAQMRRESDGAASSSAPAASTEAAEMGETSVAIPPVPNGNRVHHLEQDLQDDIKTVVRFFVDGNDRDQSEDETLVWQRLEAKTPCKTENSWETFYEKHAEVVIERYNNAL